MSVIFYEYPLNERVRIFLRLEYLADRLGELMVASGSSADHHFALVTMFEMAEICDARSDLKPDVLKELEKARQHISQYHGKPGVDDAMLRQTLQQIDRSYQELSHQTGKTGTQLNSSEWLASVRSRLNIPAGTCSFDHPSYHSWLHSPAADRSRQLHTWSEVLVPMIQSIRLLLKFLRDNSLIKRVVASGGNYQENLPSDRPFQLLRLAIADNLRLIPEISGNRLVVSVRLMRLREDRLLHAQDARADFELALCA